MTPHNWISSIPVFTCQQSKPVDVKLHASISLQHTITRVYIIYNTLLIIDIQTLFDTGVMSTIFFTHSSIDISPELRDLLGKLLQKDPAKRITIAEIRQHPWVLKTARPLLSREDNCAEEICVSEEEIKEAFKPFYTPIHILVSTSMSVYLYEVRVVNRYCQHTLYVSNHKALSLDFRIWIF